MPTLRPTQAEVAAKFNVTVEQVSQLRRAMGVVWDGIASDWLACFESETEAYKAFDGDEGAMIAEATIDADRLVTEGAMSADEVEALRVATEHNLLKLGAAAWNSRR